MDKRALQDWAREYGMKADDPLYGAFLAAEASTQGAEAATQALGEIQAAIDRIPVAAEQAPRIVEEIAALRKAVEASDARAERLHAEFGRQGEHFLKMLKLTSDRIFLNERQERQERIAAIAREVGERLDRPSRSYFGFVLILCIASLLAGGWFEHETLEIHHRIAPRAIAYLPSGKPDCVPVQGGREACVIVPRRRDRLM
jgi:hypothetical protein